MLSDLFSKIELLIPKLDGWCSVERALDLASLVIGIKPILSVCIGVYGGRDTFALALAHKYNNLGKVIAIDPWLAEASIDDQLGDNANWWNNQNMHDKIYLDFISKINELELNNFINVIKNCSDNIESPNEIDILIIDGNHGSQVIRDVEKFGSKIKIGGFVYMDDIEWMGGNVKIAIEKLQSELGCIKLYERDTGAIFQRIFKK